MPSSLSSHSPVTGGDHATRQRLNDHNPPGFPLAPATACDFRQKMKSQAGVEPTLKETTAPERIRMEMRAPDLSLGRKGRGVRCVEISALLPKSPQTTRKRNEGLTHFSSQRRGVCRGAKGAVRNPHTIGRYTRSRKSRIPMEGECTLARSFQTTARDFVPPELTGQGSLRFLSVPPL